MKIVPRNQWLTFKPRSVSRASHKGNPHVVHYYGSSPANPSTSTEGGIALCRSFAASHLSRGWSDIGYNFIILRDGTGKNLCTVLEGRGDNVRGAHSGHNEANGYAGVLILMSDSSGATPQQLETLKALTKLKGWGKRTGHLEWHPTSCPGTAMMNWIKKNRYDDGSKKTFGTYAFEELPFDPITGGGGNGPAVYPFDTKRKRDAKLKKFKDAGKVVSAQSDKKHFYVYEWRPETYNEQFRFGPWADKTTRDKNKKKRETSQKREMRGFSGKSSLYPYLGDE
jgi:hypothetical protein